MIRAGRPEEADPHSGEWAFVDVGFASANASCGLLRGFGSPEEMTFGAITRKLEQMALEQRSPLNLLLEAPLSVSFGADGNPRGRAIEKRGAETRYWYVGLGACVMVAAIYLLRAVHEKRPEREIRLFEGFASFKPKGVPSSHSNDVLALRQVVFEPHLGRGSVVPAECLAMGPTDRIQSAGLVGGLDLGVPPVVLLDG